MSPLILYMHHKPTRFAAIVMAVVLTIVWVLAPENGVMP